MDHIHLKTEAHSSLFKILSHDPVVKSDGRKILNATETKVLQLSKEHRHDAERIGAADSGQHRDALDEGQHLGCHLDTIALASP